MKKKKTILMITGTRAEYGLLRPVMREIMKSKSLKLEVIVTGMHTLEKSGKTFREVKKDGMPVVKIVPVGETDSMYEALSKEIKGIGDYCRVKPPDLILVLGDVDSSFAGAIVGGHLGIPVAHIHGGDKTGPVVDEYIRHAITKFSHIHFPATKLSASRVKLLGEESWRVYITGAPGLDELRSVKTETLSVVARRYGLSEKVPWFVVLHNPTPFDTVPYESQIRPLLKCVLTLPGEKIILNPNADTGTDIFSEEINRCKNVNGVHIFRHLPRADLVAILRRTELLLGNSSMGIIDASYLKLPAVNVGNRQAGRERGVNVADAGYDEKSIAAVIKKARTHAFRKKASRGKSPYGDGKAAARIVRFLERHIGRRDLFHKKLTYV